MFGSKDLLFSSEKYGVAKSLRFRSSASAYLNRTFGTATSATTWTWSGWVKRGALGATQALFGAYTDANNFSYFMFNSSDQLRLYVKSATVVTGDIATTAVYRDTSAWCHVLLSKTGTTFSLYVNGVSVSWSGTAPPSAGIINNATPHYLGQYGGAGTYLDGYLAEVNFIDGQALTPSSFGFYDNNGIWQPKGYTGTYGTNGFYLKFTDVGATSGANSGYGKDFSGFNTNYWTTNNFGTTSTATTYDSMLDSPVNYADGGNGRGNYAVLNPINAGMGTTIIDGNLTFTGIANTNEGYGLSTMGVDTGSFYFEVQPSSFTGVLEVYISNRLGITAGYRSDGTKDVDGVNSAYNASWTASNIIGCAFNAGTKTITFYKDNASQGSFTYTGSGLVYAGVVVRGAGSANGSVNFGQRPFAYTPPSGFAALNTQNLSTPTITNGAAYMAAVTYNGTGSSQTITTSSSNSGNNPNGTTFQPDWVWVKGRSGATDHALYDAVRGVQLQLESNTTGVETTETTGLTAFTSSGFTTGALAQMNTNTATYVAWEWNAGGSNATNTSGSITSTVRANTSAGFSVVTYTGTGANATVGHGLGVAPSMIIVKNRSTSDWAVYHKSTTAAGVLWLNLTNAYGAFSAAWNSTEPTSTVFSVGTATATNASSSSTHVAYCFAPVTGYSAFGSYTGNGSTDGPFVYTGFRPRYVMIKRTDTTSDWTVFDTSRNSYNVSNLRLWANLSDAESSTSSTMDILSNGFKLRTSDAFANASGGTYIYACFAENPFKISRAR